MVCRLDTIDARIRSRGKSDICAPSANCVADTTQVTPSLSIAIGAQRLADLGYIYGFFTSAVVYVALSQRRSIRIHESAASGSWSLLWNYDWSR